MDIDSFLGRSLFFALLIARHMAVMMYWVWVPGFLVSAFVALRYRRLAIESVRRRAGGSFSSILWGAFLGVTLTPHRRRSLDATLELLREGAHPAAAFAVYLASRNLVLYFLAIWMLLLGFEFAAGQVIGTVAMIAFVSVGIQCVIPKEVWQQAGNRIQSRSAQLTSILGNPDEPSWRSLVFTLQGWGRAIAYIGKEILGFVFPLTIGILAGGLILAAGLQSWWIELGSVGGGGILTDFLNALIAPVLSLAAFMSPVGSLPIASNLFKAYGLSYPGILAFVLAGALKPQDVLAFRRALGWGNALRLAVLFYLAAVFGGLFATGVFALFGFRPGHVPLFRELVDAIIMWVVPGMATMPGMGGMGGM